jgi:lipoate synthase
VPDISMCEYSECPKSNECWRFKAIPNNLQSYMEFKNICNEKNNYKYLYEIDGKPIKEN